jgi:pyruvate ferredoxin oxidoreductase alpha subunit
MYPTEAVQKFIGKYEPPYNLLNLEKPITVGSIVLTDYYLEHKKAQHEAMDRAKRVILEIGKEFGKTFGKEYGFFEEYRASDADYILVCLGSTAGTAKAAVEELRQEGIKVGLIKVRVFRPFPAEELAAALKNCKAIAVLDRSESMNTQAGPVATEIKAALYDANIAKPMEAYIYGLGGREIYIEDIKKVYRNLASAKSGSKHVQYLGVKE